eukprot:scaffold117247_cov52-Phaeocystis_antarctica.AAC.3
MLDAAGSGRGRLADGEGSGGLVGFPGGCVSRERLAGWRGALWCLTAEGSAQSGVLAPPGRVLLLWPRGTHMVHGRSRLARAMQCTMAVGVPRSSLR